MRKFIGVPHVVRNTL